MSAYRKRKKIKDQPFFYFYMDCNLHYLNLRGEPMGDLKRRVARIDSEHHFEHYIAVLFIPSCLATARKRARRVTKRRRKPHQSTTGRFRGNNSSNSRISFHKFSNNEIKHCRKMKNHRSSIFSADSF